MRLGNWVAPAAPLAAPSLGASGFSGLRVVWGIWSMGCPSTRGIRLGALWKSRNQCGVPHNMCMLSRIAVSAGLAGVNGYAAASRRFVLVQTIWPSAIPAGMLTVMVKKSVEMLCLDGNQSVQLTTPIRVAMDSRTVPGNRRLTAAIALYVVVRTFLADEPCGGAMTKTTAKPDSFIGRSLRILAHRSTFFSNDAPSVAVSSTATFRASGRITVRSADFVSPVMGFHPMPEPASRSTVENFSPNTVATSQYSANRKPSSVARTLCRSNWPPLSHSQPPVKDTHSA